MSTGNLETKVVSTSVAGHELLSASSSLSESVVGVIDRLGRYVLLERLGRGAFGTVWAAYDPELDRRVAIKIVHGRRQPGRDVDKTRDDLLSEAQLLAQLSHPNVVAIHDVGRLGDALPSTAVALGSDQSEQAGTKGRTGTEGDTRDEAEAGEVVGVFIVMEHLDGPTLREWLELAPAQSESAQPHELADILRVFAEAGRGLGAAHASDLVHLDFKPGNVMFGADGRVRVLDFGLARASRQLHTRSGAPGRTRVAGTPAYMAPEQHAGGLADSRADQYAFCLALWEAVTGSRPFAGEDSEALFAAKLAGPPKLTPSSARAVQVLAVLERGLAVDADQRFATMDELLAALASDPRLRRRRWMAGVVVVAGLLGAGFGLARASDEQGDPCAPSPDLFAKVWDEQRRGEVGAAFEATGVGFASEAFEQVALGLDDELAHWSAVRREVCRATLVDAEVPVEVMSEQMLCLDRRLRSIAGLSETLTHADAEMVARARDSVLALEDPERCRAQHQPQGRSVLGDDRRLALLWVEDALSRAQVLGDLGHFDDGLTAAEQAVERATTSEDSGGIARAQRTRGWLLRELGRLDKARDASLLALASVAQVDARELETQILDDLIATQTARGEFEAALAIRQIIEPRIDPVRAPKLAVRVHQHAAVLHERQQHWDQALAELELALALGSSALGAEPGLRAGIHLALGNVLVNSGRDLERGGAQYLRAVELWTEGYGGHHPLIAKARMNLSAVYFRQGDYDRAIEVLRAALGQFEGIYDADHPYVAICHQNLGAMHSFIGEFHEAIAHTREALALAAGKLGNDHPDYATTERSLASVLMLVGQYREARPLFVHAAAVYERSYDPTDTRRMAVSAELAEVSWWLGEHEQAAELMAAAAAVLEQAEQVDRRRIGPLSTMVLLELHRADFEPAHGHALELVASCEGALGPDSADLARARVQLAEVLVGLGRLDEAREQLVLARAKLTHADGRVHPFMWGVALQLGRVELADGDRDAAIEQLEYALAQAEGPEGAEVHAALVEIELADALDPGEGARAEQLRTHGQSTLREHGVRPELW